ncbi:uncharacterized protein LOC142986321 [Anticarsia gemmatalis]|uniref:uncharacterized protein LOC142986321 n=1 Tax=Anticarsia gemmatalis TaxID=129554 RepID=UPI003F76305C
MLFMRRFTPSFEVEVDEDSERLTYFGYKRDYPKFVAWLDLAEIQQMRDYVEMTFEQRAMWFDGKMDGKKAMFKAVIGGENHDFACVEPTNYYKCNICDMFVPLPFYKRHERSEMHKNYAMLADMLARPIDFQTEFDVDWEINDPHIEDPIDPTIFFCESCCEVVKIVNKQQHDTSAMHLSRISKQYLSVENIMFYIRFYCQYMIDNYLAYPPSVTESESSTEELEPWSDSYFEWHEPDQNIECWTDDEINDMTEQEGNGSVAQNLEEAECESQRRTPLYLPYVGGVRTEGNLKDKTDNEMKNEHICIPTPNGEVRVSFYNFHGIKNMSPRQKFCILCKYWYPPDRDFSHIQTEKHVKNIEQPLNSNFERELFTNKEWSHCVLCNDIVATGNDHATYTPRHAEVKEQVTVENEDAPLHSYCNACGENVELENISEHINSSQHKAYLALHPDKDEKNRLLQQLLFCKLCNVQVPVGGSLVHNSGKRHLRLAREYQQEHEALMPAARESDSSSDEM